jgi:hypothetical protein
MKIILENHSIIIDSQHPFLIIINKTTGKDAKGPAKRFSPEPRDARSSK